MFEKVSTKEIESIKERLEVELKDKDLPFQRKEEVESLLVHIKTWLEWKAYKAIFLGPDGIGAIQWSD